MGPELIFLSFWIWTLALLLNITITDIHLNPTPVHLSPSKVHWKTDAPWGRILEDQASIICVDRFLSDGSDHWILKLNLEKSNFRDEQNAQQPGVIRTGRWQEKKQTRKVVNIYSKRIILKSIEICSKYRNSRGMFLEINLSQNIKSNLLCLYIRLRNPISYFFLNLFKKTPLFYLLHNSSMEIPITKSLCYWT